ncbi:sulfurtransferase [Phytohabitans kaempferiae]|uniref:Sulfurtransferase n=1 Tax=Phytohabitans kaempferiae TaxID=1620943 RepID=A0ABV6MHY8_9ACTN
MTVSEIREGAMADSVVRPELLREQLDDPHLAVIEVHASAAARDQVEGLIPGSRPVFWKDLAWHPTDRLLAGGEEISRRLFALGAGEGSRIVLAGDPTQFASYVVWAARVRGYHGIGYLDGGLEAWRALGLPTSAERQVARQPPTRPLAVPTAAARDTGQLIGRDELRGLLGEPGVAIVDFRSPEEYAGERVSGLNAPIDHGAERHGRIPGARHLFFRELLDETGRILPAEQARKVAEARGVFEAERVVVYCRLSHRSTLGWLTLTEVLGLDNVRVYDGSWTEWGSIVGFPVEK